MDAGAWRRLILNPHRFHLVVYPASGLGQFHKFLLARWQQEVGTLMGNHGRDPTTRLLQQQTHPQHPKQRGKVSFKNQFPGKLHPKPQRSPIAQIRIANTAQTHVLT